VQRVERRGPVQYAKVVTCPTCRGTGKVVPDPCPKCNATGYLRKTRTISLSVPKGVDSGMAFRVPGAGEPSPNGGTPGDLLVVVQVKEHELFKRDGANVYMNWPLSFADAALGAKLEVPTLQGHAELSVPAGTPTDTVFRLKGSGLEVFGGRGKGDQFVQVKVQVPKKLTAEQKELLRKFADLDESKKGFFSRFAHNK
jgi:molecular chaperone DnaJ